jgi:hypothetical protein
MPKCHNTTLWQREMRNRGTRRTAESRPGRHAQTDRAGPRHALVACGLPAGRLRPHALPALAHRAPHITASLVKNASSGPIMQARRHLPPPPSGLRPATAPHRALRDAALRRPGPVPRGPVPRLPRAQCLRRYSPPRRRRRPTTPRPNPQRASPRRTPSERCRHPSPHQARCTNPHQVRCPPARLRRRRTHAHRKHRRGAVLQACPIRREGAVPQVPRVPSDSRAPPVRHAPPGVRAPMATSPNPPELAGAPPHHPTVQSGVGGRHARRAKPPSSTSGTPPIAVPTSPTSATYPNRKDVHGHGDCTTGGSPPFR